MGRDWKKWFDNENMKKLFRKDNLLILILAGILLFVIALPTKSDSENGATAGGEKEEGRAVYGSAAGEAEPETAGEKEDYAAELEKRLTEALADMAEVGKVKVMITLKSSSELVVEKETSLTRSVTTETDSQGGSRTVNTSETGDTVVYSTEGSSSTPYVVKSYVPEIEGVLVVAEGAGNGKVNRTVTEIVQALFGVEAHKIMVVKMDVKTR